MLSLLCAFVIGALALLLRMLQKIVTLVLLKGNKNCYVKCHLQYHYQTLAHSEELEYHRHQYSQLINIP